MFQHLIQKMKIQFPRCAQSLHQIHHHHTSFFKDVMIQKQRNAHVWLVVFVAQDLLLNLHQGFEDVMNQIQKQWNIHHHWTTTMGRRQCGPGLEPTCCPAIWFCIFCAVFWLRDSVVDGAWQRHSSACSSWAWWRRPWSRQTSAWTWCWESWYQITS